MRARLKPQDRWADPWLTWRFRTGMIGWPLHRRSRAMPGSPGEDSNRVFQNHPSMKARFNASDASRIKGSTKQNSNTLSFT